MPNGILPVLPFAKNVPLPPTCGPLIPQPCAIYSPGGIDPNMFTPTIQIWNFTVERQLARNLMLQVGYVGSQSYHTSILMDPNTDPPAVCQDPNGCISGGVLPANQTARVPQGTTYMPSKPPIPVGGLLGTLVQRPNVYVSSSIPQRPDQCVDYRRSGRRHR